MLSAVVTAKAQENCGFPGVAPGRVCPVTANPGPAVTAFYPVHPFWRTAMDRLEFEAELRRET